MSDLAPIFSAIEVLRCQTIEDFTAEYGKMKEELERVKALRRISISCRGGDVCCEGHLDEAEVVDSLPIDNYREISGIFRAVPLHALETRSCTTEMAQSFGIRQGPNNVLLCEAGHVNIEFSDDCFSRAYGFPNRGPMDDPVIVTLSDCLARVVCVTYKIKPPAGVDLSTQSAEERSHVWAQLGHLHHTLEVEFERLYLQVER